MKKIVVILFCLWMSQTSCWAELRYVKEVMSITMRTGAGIKHKIITMLESGEQVNVLEKGDGWTRIRTGDGREGWVLARYLTTDKPVRPVLDALNREHEKLLKKFERVSAENTALKQEVQALRDELAEKDASFKAVDTEYQTLKSESTDFITVKSDYESAQKELAKIRERSQQLEAGMIKLQNSQLIKGISIGAGILILGILIGLKFKRQRRKSSLLS
ncbi:MAG: TIGR04211 family SH3 domain-containing protein [Desulfobacterales bacterium]